MRSAYGPLLTIALLVSAINAGAQLKGHYIPGFTGLESGTQGPPGVALILPVYFYTTDDLKDDDGKSLGVHPRVNASFVGAGVSWVTNATFLGATYGGAIIPIAFMKSRIEGPSLDVPGAFGFSDIEIEPVQLGWHTPRADYVASYGFFAPTGKWSLGADDNAGLGMWSHDLQGGATVRLDDRHAWTLSALGTYELHSHKRDADIRVGDILTIEGGLGRAFYKVATVAGKPVPTLVTNVGLVYYGQFKITGDEFGALTSALASRKDRVYGVGLEGNVAIPAARWAFGARVEPEFGARNRSQGWTFMVSAGYMLKSLAMHP